MACKSSRSWLQGNIFPGREGYSMLTLRNRAISIGTLILFLLSGCGYSNPEYYKALGEVVGFLETMKLPTVEQVKGPTTAHDANIAELVRLNKIVTEHIDPRVSQRPSYAAYEKTLKDLLAFTAAYNTVWLQRAQTGKFDPEALAEIVEKGERAKTKDVAALKKAIAQENPSKA